MAKKSEKTTNLNENRALSKCVAIIGFNGCEKTGYPHKYKINNEGVANYAIMRYLNELIKMGLSESP